MPKRPRSHQIETESRNAFHAAMPPAWVTRDVTQDYGIDVEVEIFDEDERATGEKFLVQLRATEQPDVKRALAVRLSKDALAYYRSLGVPVLVVRYHVPTRRLFSKWAHTYDPYYEKKNTKSAALRMSSDDCWDAGHHHILRRELTSYLEVHRNDLPQRLVFSIRLQLSGASAAEQAGLMLQLREQLRSTERLDATLDDPMHDRAVHSITIRDDIVDVKLAGQTAAALHPPKGEHVAFVPSLNADVLTAVGIALDRFGCSLQGAEVLWRFARASKLIRVPLMASAVMKCFIGAAQPHRAIELASELMTLHGSSDALQLLMGGTILSGVSMTLTEQRLSAAAMQQAADVIASTGDPRDAATLYYNSGRVLSGFSDGRAMVRAYKRASRLYADYLNRVYFWNELAGVLFVNHRFAASARFYERAMAIAPNADVGCLLADACLFAGRYGDALALFSTHADVANKGHAEWQLKKFVLPNIIEILGNDRQSRDHRRANRCMAGAAELKANCENAIAADALNAHAWFNLGVHLSQQNQDLEALNAFLLSALITQVDLEAWCNVIIFSMRLALWDIFVLAAVVANFFNPDSFLSALHVRVVSQFSDPRDMSIVRKLGEALASEKPSCDVRVRFHLDDGGFTELRFDDETATS